LQSLNLKGRLILVGLTGGRKSEIDLGLALTKRLKIIGTVLRPRTNEEKSVATQKFAKEVLPLFEKGVIRPNLDKVFKVEDVQKAHEYLESNESFGKVVLEF
jgi:NADPH:quinone reductase-like Zn-dependent oxidoreductase